MRQCGWSRPGRPRATVMRSSRPRGHPEKVRRRSWCQASSNADWQPTGSLPIRLTLAHVPTRAIFPGRRTCSIARRPNGYNKASGDLAWRKRTIDGSNTTCVLISPRGYNCAVPDAPERFELSSGPKRVPLPPYRDWVFEPRRLHSRSVFEFNDESGPSVKYLDSPHQVAQSNGIGRPKPPISRLDISQMLLFIILTMPAEIHRSLNVSKLLFGGT